MSERNYHEEILTLIREKGPIRCTKIAQLLGLDLKFVTNTIRSFRKRFLSGKFDVYIHTTPDGYSLDETKRNVTFETNMRLAQMIGMGINSTYIRNRCKVIALKEFKQLSIIYKPKLLSIEKGL